MDEQPWLFRISVISTTAGFTLSSRGKGDCMGQGEGAAEQGLGLGKALPPVSVDRKGGVCEIGNRP